MMTEFLWFWKGGRLENANGASLSVSKVFELQKTDAKIAAACKGVLKPNNEFTRRAVVTAMAATRNFTEQEHAKRRDSWNF